MRERRIERPLDVARKIAVPETPYSEGHGENLASPPRDERCSRGFLHSRAVGDEIATP